MPIATDAGATRQLLGAGYPWLEHDIDDALDDMLFSGGRLNAQLLGGAQAMAAG